MRLWKQAALIVLLVAAGFGVFQAWQLFVAAPSGGPPVAAGGPPGGGPPGAQRPGRGGPPGMGGPTLVAATQVRLGPVRTLVEAVGTTMARQAVDIVPLSAGRIASLAIEPGGRVVAGDILAELDKDIEAADLTEAEAKLKEATLALERAETLRRNNAIAESQYETAAATVVASQAEVDRARRRLADRVVRAPFDGVIGLRRVEIGESVTPQTVLTTLDDLSEVEIEFQVSEVLFGSIRPDQAVTADSAAFPGRRFEGRVVTIDSRIDQTSRAFKVRAAIPNDDLTLPAGMFMHLSLVLNEREALVVPEEALLAQGGSSFAFVIKDGKAERRAVTLGQRDVGSVEITAGLAEGETVVTRGVQKLRDGADVAIEGEAPPASAQAPAVKPPGS